MEKDHKTYTGINIQWPISELILSGEKTIETRTYPIPEKHLNKDMLLIETPGKKGKFKSRIRGIIKFTKCFPYKNKTDFYKDVKRHYVTPDSSWAWRPEKPKWGWSISSVTVFEEPLPVKKKLGIKYTSNISI